MSVWFWLSVVGEILLFPLYYWSLEHSKLEEKFGSTRGQQIGDVLGLVSGWGFFLFLFGIWLTPQDRFTLPLFPEQILTLGFLIPATIPIVHLIIFLPLIAMVLWMALNGVKEVGLKVAETHRAERVITTGVYARSRHPQYLGAILAHIAISVLVSAWYSLLLTPFVIGYLFLLARKEEQELIKEFGDDYVQYQQNVRMWF